jgi:sodium-dependent dicarboxylate transporter 2/3/5
MGIVIWALPTDLFGIEGLTLIEQRVIALFCFATMMWITEAIPSWTTSVAIIVILLFTCSDSALRWFIDSPTEQLGNVISHKSIMACFAHPIIMLFIGGFILAIAATKSGLDVKLAKVLLKPFGTKSENVLLGFLLGSGLLCYAMANFISHTATANLLFPILALAGLSTSATLQPYGGVSTLLIGVALSSSLAMVLPISTPPNALAHATGLIDQKQMMRVGIIMGIIGLFTGYILLFFVGKFGIIS